MAKLAPITILTEPIGSILRLAELIERAAVPPSNRMESNGCRELDWLVQLRACGAFGVDCHVCVVRCSGSCRSRNGRRRLDSRVLAIGRGRCDGDWHLVHALHWDAGVHPADSRGLPLADRSAVTVCGRPCVGHCAVRGEPAENGCLPSGRWKCPDGCGYIEYALQRHGRDALTGYMPVSFPPRRRPRRVRGTHFFRSAINYLSLPKSANGDRP